MGSRTIYVDYYIPGVRLAFEYDGVQHGTFSKFFHKTKRAFMNSVERDSYKEEALNQCGARLIRIAHDEQINRETILGKIIQAYARDNGQEHSVSSPQG